MERAEKSKSMLEAFFDLNRDGSQNEPSRNLLYHEMAEHYVFKDGKWKERQRTQKMGIISRMHMIFPSAGELFYLRMLLLHVKGPTSYQDLRTVGGVVCDSYFGACKGLQLIEDDNLWVETMQEAQTQYTQRYLIRLFATIILFNEVNDPRELWRQFRVSLSNEYCHSYALEQEEGEYLTLKDLRDIFKTQQKTNGDFNLPEPEELGVSEGKIKARIKQFEEGDGITPQYCALA